MDSRLLDSLEYVLSRAGEALGLQISSVIARLESALEAVQSRGQRVRPQIYGIHSRLIREIRQRELTSFDEVLEELCQTSWTAPALATGTFPTHSSVDLLQRNMYELLVAEHQNAYDYCVRLLDPKDDDILQSREVLDAVFDRIKEVDPKSLEECNAVIAEVLFIDSNNLNAGSSFPIFGCIYLNVLRERDTWTAYLEHIIHETAHHYLFGLWTTDPILKNAGEQKFKSPLRNEPRPLSAIFHQMFVLSRVIRVWSLFQTKYPGCHELFVPYTNYQNDRDGRTFVDKFWFSVEVIEKNANLTILGQQILNQCRACVKEHPLRFNA